MRATRPRRPLICLEALTKVFHTGRVATRAVADIHLEILQGEFVCITGPSGSGKTTLLSLLGLLDTPTSGAYLLDGDLVSQLPAPARARVRNERIGIVFQSFNLIGDLTVAENIELPLTYRTAMTSSERRRRISAALGRVDMTRWSHHYPGHLSGGQQQRVAIARAVAGEPPLILADEPTGNLDSKNGDAVMALLHDLHRAGSTIVMVSHNPEYAAQAERILGLFDGQLVPEVDHARSA